ncbi:AraC family transcriptional regulator [Bacillus sp. USDA818B3_A]|uniref:AraC family transcriptional regulator n=1 Tax=Bacillus sp. USDA818B3_A TaxID=2698834 RepID=UPI00136CE281|nr:helix-turn-helix domain-containing protein [Bacillus sp. USDA818B3_A]
MNYPYESVAVNDDVPFFMLMTSVKYIAMHWHDRIEIIFVLKGQIHAYVGKNEYHLQENDLLLINHDEVHGVESSEDNRLIVLQIPLSFIKKYYAEIEMEVFDCKSFYHENQKRFNRMRTLLAQLMAAINEKEPGYTIKIHSLLLDIVYNLITKFKQNNNNKINSSRKKDRNRLTRIINYIHQNYMHPLTLNELALNEKLSVPYLSKYFQKHMGQSFIKFLNSIRLEHAVQQLLETDLPMIQIAMESGFSNISSFHKIFKDTFHTTPFQFRKKLQNNPKNVSHSKRGIETYQYLEQLNILDLEKYLKY